MLFCYIAILLPYLNQNHCSDKDLGYTCSDIENGKNILNEMMKWPRNHYVSATSPSSHDTIIIFNRIYTLALALATNSTPYYFQKKNVGNLGTPSFGYFGKKPSNFAPIPQCFNDSVIKETVHYSIDPSPSSLLLNPAIFRLLNKIGPASLHILAHMSLNITTLPNQSSNIFTTNNLISQHCQFQKKPDHISDFSTHNFQKALTHSTIAHQIGDIHGWILHIISGKTPYLYDPISKSCWKAKSFRSGGINPFYTGTQRSKFDLSRSNNPCNDIFISKTILSDIV